MRFRQGLFSTMPKDSFATFLIRISITCYNHCDIYTTLLLYEKAFTNDLGAVGKGFYFIHSLLKSYPLAQVKKTNTDP